MPAIKREREREKYILNIFIRSKSGLLFPANDRRQMHRKNIGAAHGYQSGLLLHHGSGMGTTLRDLSVQRLR